MPSPCVCNTFLSTPQQIQAVQCLECFSSTLLKPKPATSHKQHVNSCSDRNPSGRDSDVLQGSGLIMERRSETEARLRWHRGLCLRYLPDCLFRNHPAKILKCGPFLEMLIAGYQLSAKSGSYNRERATLHPALHPQKNIPPQASI